MRTLSISLQRVSIIPRTSDIPQFGKMEVLIHFCGITGFQECHRYLSEEQISSFLNKAIRGRISIRLLAEQHLSLSTSHVPISMESTQIGIVDTQLDIRKLIERSASFVRDLCDGT